MSQTSHDSYWQAPYALAPINATVTVPGSKSMTNRALILAALASKPSILHGALRSRDTTLMVEALSALGVTATMDPESTHPANTTITITPPAALHGGEIDCGLAGTVMRFVPPVAALANGTVFFNGDEYASNRPMGGTFAGLQALGIEVAGTRLPFQIRGAGAVAGGQVVIDASASSQFVSGLLLAAPRFRTGITVRHEGAQLPSMPHIEMTVDMLRKAGVRVDTSIEHQWTVFPAEIPGRHWPIEPDCSNATPFLAAAAVTGGTVRIRHWPIETTQAGDAIRGILTTMGCNVELIRTGASYDLEVTGPAGGALRGINIDMSDIGELAPTVAALAALAHSESRITGIAHLRGHETDRLAALSRELGNIGGHCEQLGDGLRILPARLHGGRWSTYADHRMATAGAILGLVVPGIAVENIETTAKTLPDFAAMWERMLEGGQHS